MPAATRPPPDTLFVFKQGNARLLEFTAKPPAFRYSSFVSAPFSEAISATLRTPAGAANLSIFHASTPTIQQRLPELAFERDAPASARYVRRLRTTDTPLGQRHSMADPEPQSGVAGSEGVIDPNCFELWQKIRQQVAQPAATGPMLLASTRVMIHCGIDSARYSASPSTDANSAPDGPCQRVVTNYRTFGKRDCPRGRLHQDDTILTRRSISTPEQVQRMENASQRLSSERKARNFNHIFHRVDNVCNSCLAGTSGRTVDFTPAAIPSRQLTCVSFQ